MDFLIQNWYLIVAVIAVLAAIGFSIYKFAGLPTAEQKEKIMAWLLYAVTKAEAEFGSGTGQAKLHYVYNMFIDKFPVAAKCIAFEAFSTMVDQALEEMRKMLQDNKKIATLVDEQKL